MQLIWCNSKTDSIVWMREDNHDFLLWIDMSGPEFYSGPYYFPYGQNGVDLKNGEERFMNLSKLWEAAKDNVGFVVVMLLIITLIFVVAIVSQKLIYKGKNKKIGTREIVVIGMLSAIAFVLILFEFPLPFVPEFYKLDFSELPVLIGAFSLGPVAGVLIELVKILLKLVIKGTTTAFVGDFANFIIGCSLVVPAAIVYHLKKTKKGAIAAMLTGTAVMAIFGSLFNAFYLLPKFSQLYGMPMEAIIAIGTAINSNIKNVWSLVLFAVVPFNLLKGGLLTVLTLLLYKRISPIIKGN